MCTPPTNFSCSWIPEDCLWVVAWGDRRYYLPTKHQCETFLVWLDYTWTLFHSARHDGTYEDFIDDLYWQSRES